jgi:hypothetical protein
VSGVGPRIRWPEGRRFAFTVFDDTDGMTLGSGRPVYDLLTGLGIRITKSVWPLEVDPGRHGAVGGSTLQDPGYLAWVRDLAAAGHEIGYHHAGDHSSERERTRRALDRFRDLLGHDPRVGADHAGNRESLAAGADRLSGWRGRLYHRAQRRLQPDRPSFSGADPSSPYFWGDLCRDRITYWRGLTYPRTDLTGIVPRLPFHDPTRPYVNLWFLSGHAPRVDTLVDRLAPSELDRLEERGGLCILYTHLGIGTAPAGVVDPRVQRVLRDLASRDGWFAPVSEVLDHLRAQGPSVVLGDRDRARMERRWLVDRVRSRERLGPRVVTHELEPG